MAPTTICVVAYHVRACSVVRLSLAILQPRVVGEMANKRLVALVLSRVTGHMSRVERKRRTARAGVRFSFFFCFFFHIFSGFLFPFFLPYIFLFVCYIIRMHANFVYVQIQTLYTHM